MCSVARWSNNGIAEVAARNMDWFEDIKSNLWVLPRGMQRDGMAGNNSLKWTSKYGSVVTTGFDLASTDGINEKHLAAHLLYLVESDYGKRDEKIPGLAVHLWLQFFLDNFKSVNEAVNFVSNTSFQLVPAMIPGTIEKPFQVHLMIEDSTGDAAIFEYVNGQSKIYHDSKYVVMTNSPTFDKQLHNLKQYAGFGGEKPLPGTTAAADRFVRGVYYQRNLPKPNNVRQTIAGIISVARNMAQPIGTSDPLRPNISATLWRTVSDLTNGAYYFESTTSPNIIWVKLQNLDFEEGAPIKKLDMVHKPDLIGDVSLQFQDATPFKWQ